MVSLGKLLGAFDKWIEVHAAMIRHILAIGEQEDIRMRARQFAQVELVVDLIQLSGMRHSRHDIVPASEVGVERVSTRLREMRVYWPTGAGARRGATLGLRALLITR